MNKQILATLVMTSAILSVFSMVSATPSTEFTLIGTNPANGQVNPIVVNNPFPPLLFINSLPSGRQLNDGPGGTSAPGADNGAITTRTNSYAFTGESITYQVLVWDKNGKEKVLAPGAGWAERLNGPVPPEEQVNCVLGNQLQNGANLAEAGYPNVRRPNDQEQQTTFNSNTMAIYNCILTIEPNCIGQVWIGLTVVDESGLPGSASGQEAWNCNPSLDLEISGNINFGSLGPGEQGSSTVSVTNKATGGTQVVISIAGSDFYDSTSSGAMCPVSNVFQLEGTDSTFKDGFWYTATQGVLTTGNKRIPYGCTAAGVCNIINSDPIFSASNAGNNWKLWSNLKPTSPGSSASLNLHLGIPQPCNGGPFTSGTLKLFAWAV